MIGPYAAGPVVAGPIVPDLLAATRSAQAAAAGLKACFAWQDAPRPVLADDLLPERAIASDPSAREQLVEEIYRPLEEAYPRCWKRSVSIWNRRAVSKARPGCSSFTPTPCATGSDV